MKLLKRTEDKLLIKIALLLFIFNYAMLGFFNLSIPVNRKIFYWPLFIKYHNQFYVILSIIAVLATLYWAAGNMGSKEKQRSIFVILFSFLLVCLCVISSLFSLLILRNVNHIDTNDFQGQTYHLSIISQFDEEGIVLLGECEQSRYFCKFHPVFKTSIYLGLSDLKIRIVDNSLKVLNGKTEIYSFDGYNEDCIQADGTICWDFFEINFSHTY